MIKQLFILLILLVPMVFAEDVLRNTTDVNITSIKPGNPNLISIYSPVVTTVSDDAKDTALMTNGLGIKIRALQLQERIELAIYQARTITTKLSSVPNISASEKQIVYNAVTKLTQLKAEAIKLQTIVNKTEAVEKFVAIKKEAITVIANAREVTQRVFTDTQKADIKGKIKQLEIDVLKTTREKIKITIRNYKQNATQQ